MNKHGSFLVCSLIPFYSHQHNLKLDIFSCIWVISLNIYLFRVFFREFVDFMYNTKSKPKKNFIWNILEGYVDHVEKGRLLFDKCRYEIHKTLKLIQYGSSRTIRYYCMKSIDLAR